MEADTLVPFKRFLFSKPLQTSDGQVLV